MWKRAYSPTSAGAIVLLTQSLAQAVRAKKEGPFYLALSGGGTAQEIFRYWAKLKSGIIDWDRIRFYWVDERCVGPRHSQSNYRYARDLFFKPVGISPKNVFRMRGEVLPPQAEADRYAQVLAKGPALAKKIPQFDLVILGIGEDGHTASIFPDQRGLLRSSHWCAVACQPATKQARITLTGPVLLNAKAVWVALLGQNKRPILERLSEEGAQKKLPAAYILERAQNAVIFTDVQA